MNIVTVKKYVKKRDGRLVGFKKENITKGIFKAAYKVSDIDIDVTDDFLTDILSVMSNINVSELIENNPEGILEDLSKSSIYKNIRQLNREEIWVLIKMLQIADRLASEVEDILSSLGQEEYEAEIIQNTIEKTLIENGHAKTAKEFILCCYNRSRTREMSSDLMKTYEEITFSDANDAEVKRENANIDGDSAMGTMLRYGSEGAKKFNLLYLVSDEFGSAHRNGDIHIHDLDFFSITETCVGKNNVMNIRENGIVKIVRASYLDNILEGYPDSTVVNTEGLEVWSRGSFVRVKNCVRHMIGDKRMLRIGTMITSIEVTEDHRVSVLRGKGIEDIKALELKVGDTLVNDKFGSNSTENSELDMIELLKDNPNIIVVNTGMIMRDIISRGNWRKFWELIGADEEEYKDGWKLTVQDLYKAREVVGVDINRIQLAHINMPDAAFIRGVEFGDAKGNDPLFYNIMSVEEIDYEGYVYDLETGNNHFAINGLSVHNCCQIDLEKLFNGGFNTGHGSLREPGEIRSYSALACIAIQSNQNDQHGGQSIPAFDHYMAPGVAKTFIKELLKAIEITHEIDVGELKAVLKKYRRENRLLMSDRGIEFTRKEVKDKTGLSDVEIDRLLNLATKYTNDQTYQAMEAMIHNLNSMHSRAGAQVPFSSINYGTDTSVEGRMVIENLLLTTEAGLGQGETPIFPIQIFKLKRGVNFDKEDPNYDLFRLSMRVSAKRMFPNYSNLDAPYNLRFYREGRPETEVVYMGCRTRVLANVYDPNNEVVTGRGNLSFTSINLPRLALESGYGNIEIFKAKLLVKLDLVRDQLLERLKIQSLRKPKNFPFLMGQKIWLGSDELGPDDDMSEILKHGTLSIGMIGLAETLTALMGKHHGEDEYARELGLEIVGMMKDYCDRMGQKYKLNFTLLATPAEGLAGRFVRIDKEKFGEIKGVTDKDYYTNSFHIPVYFPINAFKKIKIEAPYHELCNAGHITYIEMDGDPSKNSEAFESVIRYMHRKDIGYGAINHPVDRDPICGYVGIIDDICPRCGRKEGEAMSQEMFWKIKGAPLSSDIMRKL